MCVADDLKIKRKAQYRDTIQGTSTELRERKLDTGDKARVQYLKMRTSSDAH